MALESIGGGHFLEAVTARQFRLMNWAFFLRFGVDIRVTWSIRNPAEQIALLNKYYRRTTRNTGKYWDGSYWEKKAKGNPTVATPGTSRHERGYALDVWSFEWANNREMAAWARTNAALYGFDFNVGGEPWHIDRILNIRISSGNQRNIGNTQTNTPGPTPGGPVIPTPTEQDEEIMRLLGTAGSNEIWYQSGSFARYVPNPAYLALLRRHIAFARGDQADKKEFNALQQRALAAFLNGDVKLPVIT